MSLGRWRSLDLATDMHAVYCAFAQEGKYVYVKIGISVRPVQRAKQIQCGSPFDIQRFVFKHIGDKWRAREFEVLAHRALKLFATRGEWYRFPESHGAVFRKVIAETYAAASRSKAPLKWTEVPYADFHFNPMFVGLDKARA